MRIMTRRAAGLDGRALGRPGPSRGGGLLRRPGARVAHPHRPRPRRGRRRRARAGRRRARGRRVRGARAAGSARTRRRSPSGGAACSPPRCRSRCCGWPRATSGTACSPTARGCRSSTAPPTRSSSSTASCSRTRSTACWRADGVVVWVNSSGGETPIHLPPEDVIEALPGPVGGRAGRPRASGSGAPCGAPPNVGFPMTRIKDLLETGRTLSFEFFPPKNDEMERQLEKAVVELAELQPSFVSVTYGALGSSRERTRDAVTRINTEQAFPAMPHLTCVGHTRADIAELLDQYAASGDREHPRPRRRPARRRHRPRRRVRARLRARRPGARAPRRLLGRRGRPPGAPPPLARPRRATVSFLAAKLAEADFAITQFFFTVDDYLRMVDELAELGCDKPVLPGVMPIASVAGVRRMAGMNGSAIPDAAARAPARRRGPGRGGPQDRRRDGHRAVRRPPRRGRPRPPPLRPQPQRVRPGDLRQPRPGVNRPTSVSRFAPHAERFRSQTLGLGPRGR